MCEIACPLITVWSIILLVSGVIYYDSIDTNWHSTDHCFISNYTKLTSQENICSRFGCRTNYYDDTKFDITINDYNTTTYVGIITSSTYSRNIYNQIIVDNYQKNFTCYYFKNYVLIRLEPILPNETAHKIMMGCLITGGIIGGIFILLAIGNLISCYRDRDKNNINRIEEKKPLQLNKINSSDIELDPV